MVQMGTGQMWVCVSGVGGAGSHMLPPSITPSHLLPGQTAKTKANRKECYAADWDKTAFLAPTCVPLSWTVTEDRM